MVDFARKLQVVSGMAAARLAGHGKITPFLERVGVPRSTGYRWEPEVRWLVQSGPSELRRLRRELDELCAELDALREGKMTVEPMDPEHERALVLQAAVLGNSDEEIATMLVRAGGRALSHQTIHATIKAAAVVAREAYGRYFAGAGRVAAVDEIFLGKRPLLLAVHPLSLLISGLRLADGRKAEDWKQVFEVLVGVDDCSSDGARGIAKAAKEAGVCLHGDMYHALRGPRRVVRRAWERCEGMLAAQLKAKHKYDAKRRSGRNKGYESECQRYHRSRYACDKALAACCRLEDLLTRVERAFEFTTPDGKLNTEARARHTLAEVLDGVQEINGCEALAKAFATLEDSAAFTHLAVLESELADIELGLDASSREAALAQLVADTVAWRRTDKDPVAVLEAASNGTLADRAEIAVVKAVDRAVRSSSYVECVNARIRLVQVARKRLSEDFVHLLAVHHNMKVFGRGSVRAGKRPAELAGLDLPTNDWIELLALTAKELAQPASRVA